MQLLTIAKEGMYLAIARGNKWMKWADMVSTLLDEINSQQPEELKNWKHVNDVMK